MSGSHFVKASEKIDGLLRKVISEEFVSLSGSLIHVICSTKKRMKGGKLTLATIQKPSALMKYLFGDSEGELDYIIIMDELCETLSDRDIERILYNQLCYCDIDTDSENPYKLRSVEFDGFYDELKYNNDDLRWKERLIAVVESIREKDKE